ncbi:putative phage terminase large subunit-like protein [Rhodoligotrophos appendicifer]|uniref:phage terminase large subunit n=1 Tax=Rhodoligotrophos appendicifer TaxID=987056 RepID=UPI00118506C6|nr:phage terminase large subunit [Rhodoligotrophos appendicifer]
MTDDARLLRALLRQRLSVFVQKSFATLEPGTPYLHNWHIDHLCWKLEQIERGAIKRLIINVPPRSMKSITVSVAFSAWILGKHPSHKIICASYADDLARKLSSDTRLLIESDWYRSLFPQLRLNSRRPRTHELTTTQRGYRFAAGLNGSILGRGADLIIIDDPIKATDAISKAERRRVNEAFDNTLYTRLNDKQNGAIVIIMQRLHEEDLAGHVISRGEWDIISLPAIATEPQNFQLSDDPEHLYVRPAGELLHEEREPREILEQLQRALGSLTFSAQYQQAPLPLEGNVVKREWIRFFEQAPTPFDLVIASWDTASTISEEADYSVGTVWGAKGLDFYLLDLVRGRFEVPDLRRKVTELAAKWEVDQTIIEDTELGRAINQDLRRSGQYSTYLHKVRIDKEARFLAQSARFDNGQVYVRENAAWVAEWLNELLAFPNGRHDDQVDSTSQALHYLTRKVTPLHRKRLNQQSSQRPSRSKPLRSRRRTRIKQAA